MKATWVLLAGLLSLQAGCSSPPAPLNVLTGTVTYDGTPVRTGRIVLLGPNNRVATEALAKDGSYRIVNPPLGQVRVGVVCYPEAPPRNPAISGLPGQAHCSVPSRPAARLPARYAEPSESGLKVTVQPGEGQADIHLVKKADDPPVLNPDDIPEVGVKVGQMAPEISGQDLEDQPLRLGDQRGKVVALLFWGHWCNLCRERFPAQRALVERYRGQPFVLLGVNTDHDRSLARRREVEKNINWRSWWDGGVQGPVCSAWGMPGLPFAVVIDARGTVAYRGADGPPLEAAIEQALATVDGR